MNNKLEHLNPISKVKSNSSVKFLTNAAYPGNHCPMHTALALGSKIKGLSTLLIGTAECSTYARMVISSSEGDNGELHWMYLMDSHEVVFGCKKGLIDAIEQMDKENVPAILVIVTCVPEVIGEDIEGIINEIQPRIKARLTFVLMGHFKCNSHPQGSWKTLLALGSLMEEKIKSQKSINIFGRSPDDDHSPMPKFLKVIMDNGYNLRFLAPDASLNDFFEATDATLNIVLSPLTQPLAEYMEKEFATPYLSVYNAYSINDIDDIYEKISNALGIDFSNEILSEREAALILENEAKEIYDGKRFTCGAIGAQLVIPLATYLTILGMEPVIIHVEEIYPDDKKHIKALCDLGFDPIACHMVGGIYDVKILETMGIDICFGIFQGVQPQFACVSDMYELYGAIGYDRTKLLLEKIKETLK